MNAQPLDRNTLGFIILNQLLTHKCDLAQLKKKKEEHWRKQYGIKAHQDTKRSTNALIIIVVRVHIVPDSVKT